MEHNKEQKKASQKNGFNDEHRKVMRKMRRFFEKMQTRY